MTNETLPPWGNANWKPAPPGSHQFKRGHDPRRNTEGRKPGTKSKRTLISEALDSNVEAVVNATIAKALTGDVGACKLVLERVKPPLRNEGPRVQFDLDPDLPLTAQAQAVLVSMSKGEIDVDSAKLIIDMITSFAGLREVDELAKRITDLEQNAHAAATAQGVLGKVMQTAAEDA